MDEQRPNLSLALNAEPATDALDILDRDAGVALCFELPDAERGAPAWLPLVPAGKFTGLNGLNYLNDKPEDVVALFHEIGLDLAFDEEHATHKKAPKGEPAHAVGFIRELKVEGGAIHGRVEWNSEGASLLTGKKYRYYSPAIYRDEKTGRVTRLASAALTNRPNLNSVLALNSERAPKENPMKIPAEILEALELNSEATVADVVAAIEKLGKGKLELNSERESLQARIDVLDDQLKREKELRLNAEQELESGKQAERQAKAEALVDGAIEKGKATPAMRETYLKLALNSEGGMDEVAKLLDAAPEIAGDTKLDHKKPVESGIELNSENQPIAELMGVSGEDFKKYGPNRQAN